MPLLLITFDTHNLPITKTTTTNQEREEEEEEEKRFKLQVA
jgi:hypothetical protein